MTAQSQSFLNVKVIALSVVNADRANRFYAETLGLNPAYENDQQIGFQVGEAILMLKPDWDQPPTLIPNPRVTLQVADARQCESDMKKRGVTISDAVEAYDGNHLVGSFIDSEGNKIWFCSYT
jgi:catechol 2,3-dioxygenase-like lactoylglutathione lyase family enzyme